MAPRPRAALGTRRSRGDGGGGLGCRGSLQGPRFAVASEETMSLFGFGVAGARF